jgi:carbonic anhydrase
MGSSGPVLPPLFTCFQPAAGLHVYNTGASWLVNWLQEDPDAPTCVLRGGPLAAEYRLLQMHAHWGAEVGRGSEHTLEGRSFDGELHLVFYNAEYSPAEAMELPDGLAVVGMFLRQGTQPHPELDKITRQLAAVRTPGLSANVEGELNPGALLPAADQTYFTYPGSLTTPPLYESVTWLVMREPLELSAEQMDMMRGMRSGSDEESCPLVDNFRPTCCLAGRQVRVSSS